MENEGYNQIVGNSFAPIINALARDYGLATKYSGVADPSEPNYVAMLGGDSFGINSDDPYWFPGHTHQRLQLNVSKHNGIVNFANLQTATELAQMFPLPRLAADLSDGTVPNFSYIVPNECSDMHGAPPWCVDSDNTGTVQQSWLMAQGDKFAGELVNQITSSSMWEIGNNAIVITFDEGNHATSQGRRSWSRITDRAASPTARVTTTTPCWPPFSRRSAWVASSTAARQIQ